MELTITQQRALETISTGTSRSIHHVTLKSVIRLGLVEVAGQDGHRLTEAGWDLVADCGGTGASGLGLITACEEVLDAELAEVDKELAAEAHTTMVPLADALKSLAPLTLQSKRERRKADRKARRLARRTQLAVRGRVSSRVDREAARRVKPVAPEYTPRCVAGLDAPSDSDLGITTCEDCRARLNPNGQCPDCDWLAISRREVDPRADAAEYRDEQLDRG